MLSEFSWAAGPQAAAACLQCMTIGACAAMHDIKSVSCDAGRGWSHGQSQQGPLPLLFHLVPPQSPLVGAFWPLSWSHPACAIGASSLALGLVPAVLPCK